MAAINGGDLISVVKRLLLDAGFRICNGNRETREIVLPDEPAYGTGDGWWWTCHFRDQPISSGEVQTSELAALLAALAASFEELTAARWRGRAHARLQLPAIAVDKRLCDAMWTAEDARAAEGEGWCLSEVVSSCEPLWQIQKLDDPRAGAPVLRTDADAWWLVMAGVLPHHSRAWSFIHTHSVREVNAMTAFLLARHASRQEA